MAFSIDRIEAARRLSVSTRTIDRHIKNEKIRTKRIGKKMFLHEEDVESLRLLELPKDQDEYVIIVDQGDAPSGDRGGEIIDPRKGDFIDYATLYQDAQKTLEKKDHIIQDLSFRLGKAETELKNAIPLSEYKKATFLLESAKVKTDADASVMGAKIDLLEKEMKKRNSFIIGLVILFILVLAFSLVFFFYTRIALLG